MKSVIPGDAADDDPAETREWLESLEAVARASGAERSRYLLARLQAHARELGVNYPQPSLPQGVAESVIKGMYCHSRPENAAPPSIRLLGSGAILREVIAAAELLREHWQVETEVWSVTSFSELAREARDTQRWNRLHPVSAPRNSFVAQCLAGDVPVVAATITGQQSLVAPVDGVVQQLKVHTIGGVVTPAEPLMIIVPDGQLLEVEAMVLNRDIGFVTEGQPATIKVDAFPFTRYGVLTGQLIDVSNDAANDEISG